MYKTILGISTLAFLAGCAGPSVTPPSPLTDDQSKSYNASYDSVWESTVDWFAMNNIPIKNIEKASGIIGSEYSLGSNYSQVNCGIIDGGDMHVVKDVSVVANINVIVRESGNFTTVRPNVFGHGNASLMDVWNGYPTNMKLENCVSTGELERSLQTYLSQHSG
ncbi:hypothetical protein ACU8V3_02930 [Cobetia marina]|jgi:hypothetical protein